MFDTPEQKANQLIEVFSNDNTRESERKAIKHALFHIEEMLKQNRSQLYFDYYEEVKIILKKKDNGKEPIQHK